MKKILLTISVFVLLAMPQMSQAARLYMTGFEWQSVTAGVEILAGVGTPTIDTSLKHSGAASIQMADSITTGNVEQAEYTYTASTKLYARWYIYITAQDNDANVAIYMDSYNAAVTNVVSIQGVYNGSTYDFITYYNNFGGTLPSGFSLTAGAWHYVEMLYDSTPANGSEVLTIRADGAQVDTSSALTFTLKTINYIPYGIYNGTADTISGTIVNFDDIAFNDINTGAGQTSYPGAGKIVIVKPTASGDNACTTGTFGFINEVPPSDTATTGVTMCELDTNGVIGDFNVTDSSTAGIDSYDTVSVLQVFARMREETAGTSAYNLRVKSAAAGTVSASGNVDAGNTTARTNPNSTTAFTNQLFSYTDPTTAAAWTPTGTNSIDNMQVGVANADAADSTPDAWVLTLAAMVEYVDGTAPAGASTAKRRIFITN